MQDQLSVISAQPATRSEVARQISILTPGKVLSLAGICALFLVAGCRQDMHNQPKIIPQRGSEIFADHRGAR